MRVCLACVLVAAVGAGFSARAGGGDVPLELAATMSPTTIAYPGTREIVYRLELTTGATPQRVRVAVRPPVFAPGGGAPPRAAAPAGAPVGSPIRLVDPPTVEGAGRILTSTPPLSLAVAGRTPCQRGYVETSSAIVMLDLPAKSRTTLVTRAETGLAAPWPDTDYRVAYEIAVGSPPGKSVTVRPVEPIVSGRHATRIRLRLVPGPRPRRNQPVRVQGSITPPEGGTRLTLWAAPVRRPPGGAIYVEGPDFPRDYERARRLATVDTDTRGAFTSPSWLPRRRVGIYGGDYAVWATNRPEGSAQVPERSCPVFVSVR